MFFSNTWELATLFATQVVIVMCRNWFLVTWRI